MADYPQHMTNLGLGLIMNDKIGTPLPATLSFFSFYKDMVKQAKVNYK
jgi:hypothetical protein